MVVPRLFKQRTVGISCIYALFLAARTTLSSTTCHLLLERRHRPSRRGCDRRHADPRRVLGRPGPWCLSGVRGGRPGCSGNFD